MAVHRISSFYLLNFYPLPAVLHTTSSGAESISGTSYSLLHLNVFIRESLKLLTRGLR